MRHSIAFWGIKDQLNLTQTARDMLAAILVGLKHDEVAFICFNFVKGTGVFHGVAHYNQKDVFDPKPNIEPFRFMYRTSEGFGVRESIELLLWEVDKLSMAMTQGVILADWGGLTPAPNDGWTMAFFRRTSTTQHSAITTAAH